MWLQGRRLRVYIACKFLKVRWALGDSLYGIQNQARAAGEDSALQAVLVMQQKYSCASVYLRCFLSLDTSVCLPVRYLGSRNAWSACSWLEIVHSAQGCLPSRFGLVLSPLLESTGRTGIPFSIAGFRSTRASLPPLELLAAFLETVCWVLCLSGLVLSFCWTVVGEDETKHLSMRHKIYRRGWCIQILKVRQL